MKAFWQEMRGLVVELSCLDKDYKLSHGVTVHKYCIGPLVSERKIQAFETRNDIKIPAGYRAYLQHFGSGGAGPGRGLVKFPDDIWQGDLTKNLELGHLNLQITRGFIEVDEAEAQLYDRDGMLQISTTGEADYYLVVTGAMQGYVLCWIEEQGMLGVRGTFDQWYKTWIERMLYSSHQIAMLKKVKVGMHLSDVEALPYVKTEDRFNNGFLYFIYLNWSMKVDSDNRVEKLNFDDFPLF